MWGFSTRTGARARPLAIPGGEFATSLAISPDDRTLAAGTASAAYVWNLSTSAPLPAFQHADPSQFSIETAGGVKVGFTENSQNLVTAGDDALSAWAISSHLKLFHAFAFRGALSADGREFAAVTGRMLTVYPCELCGGRAQLLAVARRHLTRRFTADERASYLSRH